MCIYQFVNNICRREPCLRSLVHVDVRCTAVCLQLVPLTLTPSPSPDPVMVVAPADLMTSVLPPHMGAKSLAGPPPPRGPPPPDFEEGPPFAGGNNFGPGPFKGNRGPPPPFARFPPPSQFEMDPAPPMPGGKVGNQSRTVQTLGDGPSSSYGRWESVLGSADTLSWTQFLLRQVGISPGQCWQLQMFEGGMCYRGSMYSSTSSVWKGVCRA